MHRARYLIGVLILIAAAFGVWLLAGLLGDRPLDEGLRLQVEFRDLRGLRPGAAVRYRGVHAGTVRKVQINTEGSKALAELVLTTAAAEHACIDSTFWIVTPRFSGLTGGASGLDTLVRDAYVAFLTPEPQGLALRSGSLITGSERPPAAVEPEALEAVRHGDLMMHVLVGENFGLQPGSPVVFRGVPTGEVREVALAKDGTHIDVLVRIAKRYRHTVHDQSEFWIARPTLTGALLSGFTVSDVSALLQPYISYYTEMNEGAPVVDDWRVIASATRPERRDQELPASLLAQGTAKPPPPNDPLQMVRIVYSAVEEDTFSGDDRIRRDGMGLVILDAQQRALVVTARSLVDASYTERDTFGGDPDIAREQIKVMTRGGRVLSAGRIWVSPDEADLAVLLLEDAPPNLPTTPLDQLGFTDEPAPTQIRLMNPDGSMQAAAELGELPRRDLATDRGAVLQAGTRAAAVVGQQGGLVAVPAVVPLRLLPTELRPKG